MRLEQEALQVPRRRASLEPTGDAAPYGHGAIAGVQQRTTRVDQSATGPLPPDFGGDGAKLLPSLRASPPPPQGYHCPWRHVPPWNDVYHALQQSDHRPRFQYHFH